MFHGTNVTHIITKSSSEREHQTLSSNADEAEEPDGDEALFCLLDSQMFLSLIQEKNHSYE